MLQSVVFQLRVFFNLFMPIAVFLTFCVFSLSEITGNHLQYSKFWNAVSKSSWRQVKLSSKTGMFLFYAPAFLASLFFFAVFRSGDLRFLLVRIALTIHFFKRTMEVLFLHKYSGCTGLNSVIIISFSYFSIVAALTKAQYEALSSSDPSIDLRIPGVVLFLVGTLGNFYHHFLLSKLRRGGEKAYKIPGGGLFNLVICPHYLFEITAFIGVACISQTICAFAVAVGSGMYLVSRSYMSRKWYLSKFENFPKETRALIPYVF